ncbi:deleted in malignant brain tumors 1 protein-like [Protopterus annectens]|uniref:deleted in malignant brain tumors 1 protein-like n=1 Tax=Protopterus annectens TaxID=7888 RepID=UPI001CFA0C08|nr:deleted in malignant brain tumors 1 protein-like [Protopterus annectens]
MEPCWVLTLTTVSLFIGAMGSRLLSTGSLCSGIVEVVSQSSWGVLSANIWDNNMANVLCKETNCGTVQAILNVTSAGEESGNIWLGSTCSGTENSLESCGAISNFSAGTQVAGVVCSKTEINATVRLKYIYNGMVEVLVGDSWVPICWDSWNKTDGNVICRQVANLSAVSISAVPYPTATRWIDNVACCGSEEAFSDCPMVYGQKICASGQAAAVSCKVFPLKKVATRVVISSNAPMQDADNRIVKKAMEEQLMSMLYEGTHMYFPGIKVITRKDETTGKES